MEIYTGEVTAYTDTANLGIPIEDTNDGQGNVCKYTSDLYVTVCLTSIPGFSTAASNTLNYLNPKTSGFTAIPQPDGGITALPISLPPLADIAMHWVAQDNSMWFTELAGNRVGRYQLEGLQ